MPRPSATPSSGGSPVIEAMDGVQAAAARDAQARSRRILTARLRALAEAEVRLRDGNYGICETCGQAIPARRLAALPEARQCVACAEAAEAAVLGRRGGRHRALAVA